MRRRKWLIAAVIPTCVLIGGILLWKPIRADMGIYIEAGEPIVVFHGGFRVKHGGDHLVEHFVLPDLLPVVPEYQMVADLKGYLAGV